LFHLRRPPNAHQDEEVHDPAVPLDRERELIEEPLVIGFVP